MSRWKLLRESRAGRHDGSLGEYNWRGLAGTILWIELPEDISGLYMIEMLPRLSDGRTQFKRPAY